MPHAVRAAVVALILAFVCIAGYYRIQSQRSGDRLDRRKEGWLILIGLRGTGVLTLVCTVLLLRRPSLFEWALYPVPVSGRWLGVACLACSFGWLLWMFHSLGRNLTDTVVTRRGAYFVDHGPYRFVRNPMYTGILFSGMSLGLALGTWLLPLGASVVFLFLAVRTRTEERYLIERFGDQYRSYMKRVGRFVPKRLSRAG